MRAWGRLSNMGVSPGRQREWRPAGRRGAEASARSAPSRAWEVPRDPAGGGAWGRRRGGAEAEPGARGGGGPSRGARGAAAASWRKKISCDGGCGRSFHLTDENSEGSRCRLILGLTKEQMILAADDKVFICKNCKYKQHQCFVCGKLGSSDLSSEAEVFQCEADDCGRFYHPKCVATLLYPDSKLDALLLGDKIAARQNFTCPIHECIVCKGEGNKNDRNMQWAVCRRCPTTYHRGCLPSNIPFKTKEGRNGYMQMAWDELEAPDGRVIPRDRILIYCTKHEILKKLGTPKRNHIVFPDAKKQRVPKMLVEPPIEEDIPEEAELHDNTSPEPPQSPPPVASNQNQCSCSSPINSFAPGSMFTHPHPGTCGCLGD